MSEKITTIEYFNEDGLLHKVGQPAKTTYIQNKNKRKTMYEYMKNGKYYRGGNKPQEVFEEETQKMIREILTTYNNKNNFEFTRITKLNGKIRKFEEFVQGCRSYGDYSSCKYSISLNSRGKIVSEYGVPKSPLGKRLSKEGHVSPAKTRKRVKKPTGKAPCV